jgi:hypothetical protein
MDAVEFFAQHVRYQDKREAKGKKHIAVFVRRGSSPHHGVVGFSGDNDNQVAGSGSIAETSTPKLRSNSRDFWIDSQ